ncbi:MAG: hypothetical protein ACYDCJ_12550 [Gammaproteobacteria bacterium]
MQLDSDLNLVFPITWNDAGPAVWAYHIPIDRKVFEASYRLLAATKDVLCPKGDWSTSSPMIAALTLRDAGRSDAAQFGLPEGLTLEDGGTAAPLLAELKRLTSIMAPTASGYESLPVGVAISRKLLSEDDWMDAESALVFFTCAFSLIQRGLRVTLGPAFAAALRGSITSSSPTDFAKSLKTSTPAEASEAAEPSSVPS